MPRVKKDADVDVGELRKSTVNYDPNRSLGAQLSELKPVFATFSVWIVGDTPLITHAWSEKARKQMLDKQVGAVKTAKKEPRNPEQDFVDSLYKMPQEGVYGFPAMGIKNCLLSAAHKEKGIARSTVQAALWIDSEIVATRPALAGAVCNMPLIRIYGAPPQMREDMVKIGSAMNKTSSLAYRSEFPIWAMRVTGKFNIGTLQPHQLAFLFSEAGTAYGIGEWRNERRGLFGAFHMANAAEEEAWEAFAAGTGDLPVPEHMQNIKLAA